MGSETKELDRFMQWWKCDHGRSQCTMIQAINLYCATYPGRIPKLVQEYIIKENDK